MKMAYFFALAAAFIQPSFAKQTVIPKLDQMIGDYKIASASEGCQLNYFYPKKGHALSGELIQLAYTNKGSQFAPYDPKQVSLILNTYVESYVDGTNDLKLQWTPAFHNMMFYSLFDRVNAGMRMYTNSMPWSESPRAQRTTFDDETLTLTNIVLTRGWKEAKIKDTQIFQAFGPKNAVYKFTRIDRDSLETITECSMKLEKLSTKQVDTIIKAKQKQYVAKKSVRNNE